MRKVDNIKRHFEEEAREYDGMIRKLIPYYEQMIEALVSALPFDREETVDIIDLGCGTGTVASSVKKAYAKARMTCLDLAQNMLAVTADKLNDPEAILIKDDLYHFDFPRQYNGVVSSLALHHLMTIEDKQKIYRKIYQALKPGGIFVNADVVLAANDTWQETYINQWKKFIRKSISAEEMENKWMPSYYEEDHPVQLTDHFAMLQEAGFKTVDVIWKYYNFAVVAGVK
jgi:tRNA (cmo5U34)-methyltransferase